MKIFTLAVSFVSLAALTVCQDTYEYIIIGSGPGGGPLAVNLARNGHSVLLLEAGEDNGANLLQQIPFFANPVSENPTMSWEFFVNHYKNPEEAQKDDKYTWKTQNGDYHIGPDAPTGAEPLGILYPRAGTLGGCGNHNAMNFALPPDNDWEAIANLTGDPSWKASNMRHYFEQIEKCNYLPTGTKGHGFDGWLNSNNNNFFIYMSDPGHVDIVQAGMRSVMGDNRTIDNTTLATLLNGDMNRADPDRYQYNALYNMLLHVDDQRRRSSSQTYIRDTVDELNDDGTPRFPLKVSTSSLATKVLFDQSKSKPRAIGVEYLGGQALYRADRRHDGTQVGVPMTAYASKEVIVSGGAFNTPQILKLSGVGPRDELERFNISVVVDLPAVGTNLQDNYEAGVEALASANFKDLLENCTNLAPGDRCLREWQKEPGNGPYGLGAAPLALLYKSSRSENDDTDLFLFGGGSGGFRGFYPGFSHATAPPNLWWWSIVKMQVQNRAGTVTLRSNNPQDVPEINFNYFQEGADHDLQALEEGVRLVKRIFDDVDGPSSPFNVTEPPDMTSGDRIRERVRYEAWGHHATSSCPIGREGDSRACVDSQFRVQGVDGLRVVDASVFPRVPGAFPILPTFMISEKATAVLLNTT